MTIGVEGRGGGELAATGPLVPIEYVSQLAAIEQLTWTDVEDHTIIQRTEGDTPLDMWIWATGSSEPDGKFGFALSVEVDGFQGKQVRQYIDGFAASYRGVPWGDSDKHQPQYIISTEVGNYLLWAEPEHGAIRFNTLGDLTDDGIQLTELRHGKHNSARSFADFADISGRLIGGCSLRSPKSKEMPRLNIEFELPETGPKEEETPSKAVVVAPKEEEKQESTHEDVPKLKLVDVAGLRGAKMALQKVAEAFYHPEVYEKYGLQTPRIILLRGGVASGKRTMAEAFAGEIRAIYREHTTANLYKKMYGETEATIQKVFSQAKADATDVQPVVLAFPHMDLLFGGRVINESEMTARAAVQLEAEMKKLAQEDTNVFVVATTRRDTELAQEALFDKSITVSVNSLEEKAELIGDLILLKQRTAFDIEATDVRELAKALRDKDSGGILSALGGLVTRLVELEIETGEAPEPYDTATAVEAIKRLRTS